MELTKLIYLFKTSLDTNLRENAENELNNLKRAPNLSPALLNIVINNDVEEPVRQAAAIYLKRQLEAHWVSKKEGKIQEESFCICEEDKQAIRDGIVLAIVNSPNLIKNQLNTCIYTIITYDLPEKWAPLITEISFYLQSPDISMWHGALLCLHQIVKKFKFKNCAENCTFFEAMKEITPLLLERCVQLLPDSSEHSVTLQKLILKIYCTLIYFNFSPILVPINVFEEWIKVCRVVVDRDVPNETYQVSEELRGNLPWWNCKKWAMHVLLRVFEGYGCPKNVPVEFESIAQWHVTTLVGNTLEVLLKVLEQYQNKLYVAPRVLQETLNYLAKAVGNSHCWKLLKNPMPNIITKVLFPLMCFTDKDEQLWDSDPYEYISLKFDIVEDCISPVSAAEMLLLAACKRKMMLKGTFQFILEVFNNVNSNLKEKDGAMHMLGSLSDIIINKKDYASQMDNLLCQFIFPELLNPVGLIRARAHWIFHRFCPMKMMQDTLLKKVAEMAANAVLNDVAVPVKLEAAISIQMMLTAHPRLSPLLGAHVKPISLELLKIIKDSENDVILNVMQVIVRNYPNELSNAAADICDQLVNSTMTILDALPLSDEKITSAMGLLSTIDSLLSIILDSREIIDAVQPGILHVVHIILNRNICALYDEVFNIIASLTAKFILPDMWQVLEAMYKAFQNDGLSYFTGMMPALHNFIIVDPEAFLSNENHLIAIFNMCKAVLNSDAGNNYECYAAKLLEVIILQYRGRIDQCVPSFIDLIIMRLMREITNNELRTMCIHVLVAAFYCNPCLLLECIHKSQAPAGDTEPMVNRFITEWIKNIDNVQGLHDRKLCVLGLCQLITLISNRPPIVNDLAPTIVPTMMSLLETLKKVYAVKASFENSEDDATDNCTCDDSASISSNEDVLLENQFDDPDGDDKDQVEGETALETYITVLDTPECNVNEYLAFQEVMQGLQSSQSLWYQTLTCQLTPSQQENMKQLFTYADQKRALAESQKIGQNGGYVFQTQTVPTTFNFNATSS